MHTMCTHFKHNTLEQAFEILKDVLATPENYLGDEVLVKIAEKLITPSSFGEGEGGEVSLNEQGVDYTIFGQQHIEEGALLQMNIASKLPVAVAGALMPDAHQGYGLPIGGVLATNNAIIPYAVGVDIGCRMCLSIFDIKADELKNKTAYFQRELVAYTLFGAGKNFEVESEHEIMSNVAFNEIELLKTLKRKAAFQLGSSGSGNLCRVGRSRNYGCQQ
jgi:tRNA-splicing ligase RtcB (3'-phosphate/5'-hydroxy nucleic acid ligase)